MFHQRAGSKSSNNNNNSTPAAPTTSGGLTSGAQSDVSMRETSPANNNVNASAARAALVRTHHNDSDDDEHQHRPHHDDDDEEEDAAFVGERIRSELRRVAQDCDIPIRSILRTAKSQRQVRQQLNQQQQQQQQHSTAAAASASATTNYGTTTATGQQHPPQRPSTLSDAATLDGAGGAMSSSSTAAYPATPNAPPSHQHGGGFPNTAINASNSSASGGVAPSLPAAAASGNNHNNSNNNSGAILLPGRGKIPHARVVHVDLSELLHHLGDDDDDDDDDGNNENDGDFEEGGGPVMTHISNATMGASSNGTNDNQPLLPFSNKQHQEKHHHHHGGGGGGGAGGGGNKPKRGVKFQTGNELEKVVLYEVDNSVYLRIEYRRPIFGWLCLTVALLAQAAQLTVEQYFHRDGVSPYASAMWTTMGQIVLVAFLCLSYMAACYNTHGGGIGGGNNGGNGGGSNGGGGVAMGLFRYSVLTQVAVAALMYTLVGVARQANAKFAQTSRQMTASALHPLLIAMFGLVFRNTVFYEEVAGILVFIGGFALAMMPKDIEIHLWGFAEVVALAGAIYTASMLFTLVKARAQSVPAPVLAFTCSLLAFIVQCVVAPAATSPYGDDLHLSFAGFSDSREHWLGFLLATIFSTSALLSFIKALQFLPPITVSVAIALSPIISVFTTRILNNDRSVPSAEIFTVKFAIGATLTVMAAIYVLYISSIKRQRVDMLMRSLSRRRRPRDPYNRPGFGGSSSSNSSSPKNNDNINVGTLQGGSDGKSGGPSLITTSQSAIDSYSPGGNYFAAAGASDNNSNSNGRSYSPVEGGENNNSSNRSPNNNMSEAFTGNQQQPGRSPHSYQHHHHHHHPYSSSSSPFTGGGSGPTTAAVSTMNPTGRIGSGDLATPPLVMGNNNNNTAATSTTAGGGISSASNIRAALSGGSGGGGGGDSQGSSASSSFVSGTIEERLSRQRAGSLQRRGSRPSGAALMDD